MFSGKFSLRLVGTAALLPLLLLTGWAPSARADTAVRVGIQGVPNVYTRPLVSSATPPANQTLYLTFALHSDRKALAEDYAKQLVDRLSPTYHKFLTEQQFGQMFGATDADIQNVVSYIKEQGFTITHLWPNRLFISVKCTVAQANQSFDIRMQGYKRDAAQVAMGEPATFWGPDRQPTLPQNVAASVDAVFGFDNMGQFHHDQQAVPLPIHPNKGGGNTAAFSQPMSPSDVSTFYQFNTLQSSPYSFNGSGQSIGIFSPTNVSYSDISFFTNYWGLGSGPAVGTVSIDGGPTDYNGQGEACLDSEVFFGQAPQGTLWFYEEPNNLSLALDCYNAEASNSVLGYLIPVFSESWGASESFLHANGWDTAVASWHTVFTQMFDQGQAYYASSGDGGAGTILPAADPYVTAVGGTDSLVDNSDGTYSSEQGWSGSGGGNSIYYPLYSWETGPGVSNGYSNGQHQEPAVAADGGPNPGYYTYSGGNWYHTWGTSASSPLWATANVLMNEGTQSLGYGSFSYNLSPFLYDIGNNLNAYRSQLPGAFVFHDVTSGNNGYPCTDGWDYVTGWGSFRAFKLYADDVLSPGVYGVGISVSNSSTSNSDPGVYDNLTTYYLDGGFGCGGPADFRAATLNMQVDGNNNSSSWGPLPAGFYWPGNNLVTTAFTLGTHVINQIITNSYGSSWTLNSRTITVLPAITSFTVAPSTQAGSLNLTGKIYLSGGAPSGGAKVAITSSDPSVVPETVTIAAGYSYKSFSIKTKAVTSSVNVTITATYNTTAPTAGVTINPIGVGSFKASPNPVVGGSSTTGTVTLQAPAAPGSITVTFASANTAVVPTPGNLVFTAGVKSKTLTIHTNHVTAKKTVKLSATANGITKSFTLTVNP